MLVWLSEFVEVIEIEPTDCPAEDERRAFLCAEFCYMHRIRIITIWLTAGQGRGIKIVGIARVEFNG